MQAALALTGGSAPRRRRSGGRPWIVALSAGAHLLVLAGLVAGVQVMPQLVEPPAISVELLHPTLPPETLPRPVETKPDTAPRAAPRPFAPVSPVTAPPAPVPVVRPSAPVGAIAPPGFKARELTGGGDALRQAARDGIGCRNADVLALTKAERAACAETLGEKNKNRPAMYAVIDPDKKAAFDGACKKDDDWCLYRTGKGPYPGIFALGKKKKIKGWDD